MLRVYTSNDRVNYEWKLEVTTQKGGVLFSEVAHNLLELAELLIRASDVVTDEYEREEEESDK